MNLRKKYDENQNFSIIETLAAPSNEILNGKIEIIGVGGVDSGESAYKKFQSGASYVQLYTGMVFQGPNIVGKIKKELKEILIAGGVKNFKEIVGKKLAN